MSKKCQNCDQNENLVEFSIILRIEGVDYRFLNVYCIPCFDSFAINITKDIKIKFFNPVVKFC